ncbi:hypothetical protein ACJX0J_016004, partial [Zea mays]
GEAPDTAWLLPGRDSICDVLSIYMWITFSTVIEHISTRDLILEEDAIGASNKVYGREEEEKISNDVTLTFLYIEARMEFDIAGGGVDDDRYKETTYRRNKMTKTFLIDQGKDAIKNTRRDDYIYIFIYIHIKHKDVASLCLAIIIYRNNILYIAVCGCKHIQNTWTGQQDP